MKLLEPKGLNQRISELYTPDRAFAIMFFFAVLVRCYEITLPYMKHWEVAFQEVIARNHLLYGFLNTHFVSVLNVFHGQNLYHLAHPPLFPILLAISFKIFGIHEWSARLVPILFSLGGIVLIYLTVQKVWDKKTALLSSIFVAFVPISAYFGRIVIVGAVALFFALLVLYAYVNWIENSNNRWFLVMVMGAIIGGLTDWPFYLILPCLLGYSIITRKKVKSMFLLLCIGALIAASYLSYSYILTDTIESFHHAVDRHEGSNFYLNSQFYTLLFDRIMFQHRGFTFVVGFLSLFWIWDAIRSGIKRENLYEYLLVLALFLFGTLYIFLFPQLAYIHDFTLYYLIPFFAVSAALALKTTPKKVLIIVVIIFLAISFTSVIKTHSAQGDEFIIGNMIQTNSKPDDIIVSDVFPIYFYSNRTTFFVQKLALTLNKFVAIEQPEFVVIHAKAIPDSLINKKEFKEFLESEEYAKIISGGFEVWQLHHPPLIETLKIAPAIKQPINANFSNKIEFLGYNIDKTKLKIGDTAHITYYWQCLARMEEDYTVFVHFTDKDDKIIFQQDHPFCHGEYPTSEWNISEIIKEEYYFSAPPKVKEGAYDIRIGVHIPHKERMDVITTENGTWDGWRLVIGKITIDIPWKFKYKTHAWLISTVCIYLLFLGFFYRKRLGF
jgi:hypothetical protein